MAVTHELSKPKAAPTKKSLERDGLHLGGPARRSISCACGWAVYASADDECSRQAAFHMRNKGRPTRAQADRMRKARARKSTPR